MKRLFLIVAVWRLLAVCSASAVTPTITSQPQSVTNNNASDAAFTVVATNAATYQWQFQGTNALEGDTNATLSLEDVATNQAGSYTVVVTSADGTSVTSAPPAVLTIIPGTIVQFTISTFPDGSSSNLTVQLFDHDKPATVENFIHYITSGAYSNMFFDRDVTNFVLQGGDYFTADRTNSPLGGGAISPGSNFPSQVESEFNLGPLIHNTFGTMAMALAANEPDSATSAFFFNLADNSSSLDTNTGGFTVFGRVVSGSNVLQYFNTLSAPSNGISDYYSGLTTLPVNDESTNPPGNSNLFYCDFTFQTTPPVDTNPPIVSISLPAPNAVFTNGYPLAVQGTAHDDVGLAEVFCVLSWTNGDSGGSVTNAAVGTTNWSLDLTSQLAASGDAVYTVTALAQDGAGNLSAPVTESFTVTSAPPGITIQPVGVTNNAGSTATLTVAATNAATYQWQQQGTGAVTGATNATLTLEDLTSGQAGTYTVVITGLDGSSVTSQSAVVTVVQGTMVNLTFSGYADGSISNVVIELFNQDKPATVENFIHYIASGEYTNLFWSRCVPGFVLQGGDYVAEDRTNTSPGLTITNLATALKGNPAFPNQVDNEFNVGPLLHNTVDTIAMAKVADEPDSAHDAFFFNLADNSATLDNQNGGFTVFGRVVSGANVLQFFNTLPTADASIVDYTNFVADSELTSLPVNYNGANEPANTNLFFCDLTFQGTPPVLDTTPPAVTITSPANNTVLTNGSPLTITGTASDNVGLAEVFCVLTSVNGAYGNQSQTNAALGTTNWSLDLVSQLGAIQPGIYQLTAFAQDGAGNLSQNLTQTLTITAVTIEGGGTAQYVEYGTSQPLTNAFGANFQQGVEYEVEATPDAGQTFVNWTYGSSAVLNSNLAFFIQDGLLLTANFISNTAPPIIAFTNPTSNSLVTNRPFNIGGTISGAATPPVQVTFEVFPTNTLQSVTGPMTVTGTNSFSIGLTNLAPGDYLVQAVAQDAQGIASVISNTFTVAAAVTIITNVAGSLTTNAPLYTAPGVPLSVTAQLPEPGQQFYTWAYNNQTSINPVETVTTSADTTLTVTFLPANLPAGLTITSPASGSQAPAVDSTLTLSGGLPSTATITQLVCQLYLNSNSVFAAQHANISGTNWSLTVTNYANGAYTVLAMATDTTSNNYFAKASFTLLNEGILTLNFVGGGRLATNLGPDVPFGTYTVKAVPNAGQAFYSWSDGVTTTLNSNKTFTITSNLTLTATFVPKDTVLKGITFTYPPANARLTTNTFSMEGRIPASLMNGHLTCQLFLQSNGVTALPQSVALDPATKKWSLPVNQLTPGPYTVLVVGSDNEGHTNLVAENFNLLARLAVAVQAPGAGTVTPGFNGKYLEVGKSYKISATPKPGKVFAFWTGGASDPNSAATAFVMSSNTVLTAYFTNNLFIAVAGTYTGLFLDPGSVSPTNAGFVTITTTGAGVFSGRLMFPSRTYSILSEFPYTGFTGFSAKGFDTNGLNIFLSLDLTNGTDTITGFVSDGPFLGPYIWSSSLVLNRSVTRTNAPPSGKYVVLLQPGNATNSPVPSGYAAISLGSTGNLALGGSLPDNTAISESAKMSKDGVWPVYIVPAGYRGKGMIIGWQTNTPAGACEGQLFWVNPKTDMTTNLTSTGAKFESPVANTQYQMVLADGTSNSLTVHQAGRFESQPPTVEISLLPTGVLSGHIDKLPFKGAFISPSAGGAGFIIDGDQTEGFTIDPPP